MGLLETVACKGDKAGGFTSALDKEKPPEGGFWFPAAGIVA